MLCKFPLRKENFIPCKEMKSTPDKGCEILAEFPRSDLTELAAMEYCLSVGLSFNVAASTAKRLKEKEPEFTNPGSPQRFMLCWDGRERSLELLELDLERAITCLKAGQPVIPVWLDMIHQRLVTRLAE
jgi:hypothetical protein